MEENTQVLTAASQPEETAVETATKTGPALRAENPEMGEPGAAMPTGEPEEENGAVESGDTTRPGDDLPVIRAKFNKQERVYSLDEARPLVEKGLKYDAIQADYDRLRYLAKSMDIGVSDLVERLMKSSDDKMYNDILSECDGNETAAKQLFEYRKSERDQKFARYKEEETRQEAEEAKTAEKELTQRLAQEYIELSREFPGKFSEFKHVPQSVVNEAIQQNISLMDAYLRFQHREAAKTQKAKTQQEAAKQSSAGSMAGESDHADPDFSDFSAAFHSALY